MCGKLDFDVNIVLILSACLPNGCIQYKGLKRRWDIPGGKIIKYSLDQIRETLKMHF